MDMKEQIAGIRAHVTEEMRALDGTQALESLRVKVLGKKGELTALLRGMGQLSPEERPQAGQLINQAREEFTALLDEKQREFKAIEQEAALRREAIDVTQPCALPPRGSAHPITLCMNEMVDCFTGMGFEVVEGPEVELDHYNFELMNIPKNHPARDAQDTFYIDDNVVLRTHTSPMQARTMLTRKPPIRVICPGRVYRADEVDASHSPVFHQMEGLVVDKDVTMADLRGTLNAFAERLYGKGITTRFRPASSPSPSPPPRWTSPARPATARDAGYARAPAGSRCWAAAWSTPRCWRCAALTAACTPASPLASAWSASPCSATASPTCACSTRATCASWASSGKPAARVHPRIQP